MSYLASLTLTRLQRRHDVWRSTSTRIRILKSDLAGGLTLHVSGSGVGRSRFGDNLGHFLPITPVSTTIRNPTFATMSLMIQLLLFFEAGFVPIRIYHPK
jgi:hypothetical protein